MKAKKGAGLRFLTETITSPSLAAQIKQILTDFPEAKWHQYEPVNRDNARAGAVMAFGQPVNTTYDFSKAERILSLGSDFLSAVPGTLRYVRDYAAKRRIAAEAAGSRPDAAEMMSRLYVVESTPTITGANADNRFSVKPAEMEAVAQAVSGASIVRAVRRYRQLAAGGHQRPATSQRRVDRDCRRRAVAGSSCPGACGQQCARQCGQDSFLFRIQSKPTQSIKHSRCASWSADIDAGKVDVLIIIGGNPAYNTPADLRLDFNRLNGKVKLRAHLSLYNNETSEICHWHINAAHYLESWGDTRAYDGTASIVQPLIAPLYEGRTAYEVLGAIRRQLRSQAL